MGEARRLQLTAKGYKGLLPKPVSMEKTLVEFLQKPALKEPYLIEGLPGIGNVGVNVARALIKALRAELVAYMISPFLPDYVVIEDGICRLPMYKFYAARGAGLDLIILTGDAQPPQEESTAHYELCEEVVALALRLGVKGVVGIGGFLVPGSSDGVLVAYASEELGKKFMEAGAKPMPPTRIVGATGLIPALAAERGMESACLLGVCSSPVNDREASNRTLRVLVRGLGIRL